jgi:hypothetical protein
VEFVLAPLSKDGDGKWMNKFYSWRSSSCIMEIGEKETRRSSVSHE